MVNAWAETTFTKDQLNFLLEHWFAVVAFFECGAGEQISTDDVDALNLQLRTVLPEGWAQTEDSMAAHSVVMDAMVTDPQTTCNIGLKFLREHIESARQLEMS